MASVLGWFALATIFAETFAPKVQYFSHDPLPSDSIFSGSLAEWAAAAAPLRGDLLAYLSMNSALAARIAGNGVSSSETAALREEALGSARLSLAFAPHSSSMWLLLTILQDQRKKRDFDAETLKMSYLTSSSDITLLPYRLAIFASSTAITDVELQNLARSDIRQILTHRPDLKPAILSAYRRASADGKAYLDHEVRSLDPTFAAELR